jgi:hypothetical protein
VVITLAAGHRGTQPQPDLAGQNAHQQEEPMNTLLPRPGTHPRAALLRPLAAVLAAVACGLLATAATIPAAFASPVHVPGGGLAPPLPGPAQVPAQIHTVTVGGMPGWQITLIAAGAAVLAALLAVTAERVRAARRHITAPSL